MRRVLCNTQSLDNYLDDVLTHTPDWTQHLGALRQFFDYPEGQSHPQTIQM